MKYIKYLLLLSTLVIPSTLMHGDDPGFVVGGWLAYWSAPAALESVKQYIRSINEISPFAYEVDAEGVLINKFFKKLPAWQELKTLCARHNVAVIPTILWANTAQLHNVLSDKKKRQKHIDRILSLIKQHNYKGININYERISSHDRAAFLEFLQTLSTALRAQKLKLYCTLGARVSDFAVQLRPDRPLEKKIAVVTKSLKPAIIDFTPVALSPGRAQEAAHYKKTINNCCDRLYIMAYDEWGKAYYDAKNMKDKYYISLASKQWIEKVIQYFLSYIPAHKLVLGIPTYGLEFEITSLKSMPDDINFKKQRSVTFSQAQKIAAAHRQIPRRSSGGELCFSYLLDKKEYYVCYMDSEAIIERISLAQKHNLKGVCLFKFDAAGDEDLMWKALEKAKMNKLN